MAVPDPSGRSPHLGLAFVGSAFAFVLGICGAVIYFGGALRQIDINTQALHDDRGRFDRMEVDIADLKARLAIEERLEQRLRDDLQRDGQRDGTH
jgi:hypothetical protein